MSSNLEKTLDAENNSGNWIKKAFKEEWPTMGNHLLACGISIGAATAFSHFAPEFITSDAIISGGATFIDAAGYWGSFLPQLAYRDRGKMKDSEGNLDKKKVVKKLGEYLGYMGVIEGIYALGRFTGQYYLQKNGWTPEDASLAIQTTATALFTWALPPIRYLTKQWSEK